MSFHIMGRPDDDLRLKSATALVSDGKASITIILETASMLALGHAMENLNEAKTAQSVDASRIVVRGDRDPRNG